MTRSRSLFSLLSLAALAVASACSAVASTVSAGFGYARDFVVAAFADAPRVACAAPSQAAPRVSLVAAKAFAHRLMKRRPTVQPASWRMCPSI